MAGRFNVGSEWPVRAFAVTAAVGIWISGEYPFALGMALGLLVISLRGRGRTLAVVPVMLATLLASPLAFALLAVSLAGIALGQSSMRHMLQPALLAGVALCGLVGAALQHAFPIGSYFHFNVWALFQVLGLTVLAFAASARLRGVGVIRGMFVAMGIAAVVAYLIPSPLGGNATRLSDYIAAPLIWVLLARQLQERRIRRAVAVALGALALGGQLAPDVVSASLALDAPSTQAGFWAGGIRFLHAHDNPDFRVEAVDSAGHWDAYYLPAAGIPIVRGWFRQDDFPANALLYESTISPEGYRAWLRSNGVRYVVLPDGPLDYSATAEARLLESGHSGLPVVYRDRHLAIYGLPRARPLLTAPEGRHASVLFFGHASMTVRVSGPGRYSLAVRYTPYWDVSPHGSACLFATPSGFTTIVAGGAGTIRLRFAPTLTQLFEGSQTVCPTIAATGHGD
jgi:hypothetical protein